MLMASYYRLIICVLVCAIIVYSIIVYAFYINRIILKNYYIQVQKRLKYKIILMIECWCSQFNCAVLDLMPI